MTNGSYDQCGPTGVVIQRGRMALEALKSREQAALFHAARADLQGALSEAEAGNDHFLQKWLQQYRSLMEEEPELQHHFASVQNAFELFENTISPEHDASQLASALVSLVPVSISESPWPAMIAGATQRAKLHAEHRPHSTDIHDPQSIVDEAAQSRPTSESIALVENSQSQLGLERQITPRNLAIADAPLVISASLQASLEQERKSDSKKKWAWLSSSVIVSMAAHVIALVVMSTYVIHLARNPEPKAIVASTVETETISMEAPMEMSTSDAPTLDPSEAAMPTLPSFAAAEAASSSDFQLPDSVGALTSNAAASPNSNAIEKATSSPMSNSVANSVQFFGVKAAGNTFCYVVDGSPSMKKDGAFAAAKAELVRSLSLLKPKQRFYISFFGGQIERLKLSGQTEELYPVYATPDNFKKTLMWIDRVQVQERGLAPNNALVEAIKMDPDGIFLLFDGDTSVDVAAHLRKANRSDDLFSKGTTLVPIHTIGFYTQEFEALMKRIAVENSGTYRFVPNLLKPR